MLELLDLLLIMIYLCGSWLFFPVNIFHYCVVININHMFLCVCMYLLCDQNQNKEVESDRNLWNSDESQPYFCQTENLIFWLPASVKWKSPRLSNYHSKQKAGAMRFNLSSVIGWWCTEERSAGLLTKLSGYSASISLCSISITADRYACPTNPPKPSWAYCSFPLLNWGTATLPYWAQILYVWNFQ